MPMLLATEQINTTTRTPLTRAGTTALALTQIAMMATENTINAATASTSSPCLLGATAARRDAPLDLKLIDAADHWAAGDALATWVSTCAAVVQRRQMPSVVTSGMSRHHEIPLKLGQKP